MDKGLMNDATSTDESPTSGYMLSEIARATKSSYQANTQIQQYLVDRLAKTNHNTKFKTLLIIKHVCRTGRPEFKREMGRNVDAIKECLQFKGPPDPLRGDEIYRRVRECAKEVLEALFDGQMPTTTSLVAASGRVTGIGSDYTPSEGNAKTGGSNAGYLSSFVSNIQTSVMGDGTDSKYAGHPGATSSFSGPNSGSGGGNFGGNSGVANNTSSGGFGNPNFVDPRNEKSWLQTASSYASSAASALPGFSKTETKEPLQSNGFSGNTSHNSGTFNRSAFSNPGTDSGYNYATNRGPNAINAGSSPYGQQQQQPQSFVPDMPANVAGYGRAGGGMSSGEYEKSMIDALCEPGGLRPVPPEDKMLDLLSSASTLSEEIVGNCLLDVLNDEAWQSRTKALIVISRLVKLPDCPAYQRWWAERADIIESLQTDPKAGVRTQAVKTLRAIDPSSAVAPPAAAASAAPRRVPSGITPVVEAPAESVEQYVEPTPVPPPAPPVEVLNLLDMDDDVIAPVAPQPVYNPPATNAAYCVASPVVSITTSAAMSPLSQDDGSEFFGPGMTLSPHHAPAPVAPTAPTSFGGVALYPGYESDADSMFSGMSVGPSVGAAAAPAPALAPALMPPAVHSPVPTPVSAAPANSFDFLSAGISTSASGPAASNNSADIDLFGSLTISDHSAASAPAPAPAPPTRAYQDDFADLLGMSAPNNVPASSASSNNFNFGGPGGPSNAAGSFPAGNGLPAMSPQQQQQFLQYQQFLAHQQQQQQQQQGQQQQQQYMQGGAPQPVPGAAPNNIGLYLTRPVPGPGSGAPAPGQSFGYNQYPPRGAVPQGQRPPPMAGSPQPAVQLRQGASVIAPGMLSHTAERKHIPTAGPVGNSGFNFMGGAPAGAKPTANDSFSFVTDAMRSQK